MGDTAFRRELKWALRQARSVDEVLAIDRELVEALIEVDHRLKDLVEDERLKLEAVRSEASTPAPREKKATARDNPSPSPFLTAKQAAEFLGMSTRTIDKWRLTGGGPLFAKIGGSVRYQRSDLEAWVQKQKRRSTSFDPKY